MLLRGRRPGFRVGFGFWVQGLDAWFKRIRVSVSRARFGNGAQSLECALSVSEAVEVWSAGFSSQASILTVRA